jgi:hypothetical protein
MAMEKVFMVDAEETNFEKLQRSIFPTRSLSAKQKSPPIMKIPSVTLVAAALAFAAGCASTPASRIEKQKAAFDSWPADVQQKVSAGQVAVGFTPEMVRVALGEPDRVSTRTTEKGQGEVWSYTDRRPRLSFGLGVGTARGGSAYGGGVSVGNDRWRDDEALRVIFASGQVSAIETRK